MKSIEVMQELINKHFCTDITKECLENYLVYLALKDGYGIEILDELDAFRMHLRMQSNWEITEADLEMYEIYNIKNRIEFDQVIDWEYKDFPEDIIDYADGIYEYLNITIDLF